MKIQSLQSKIFLLVIVLFSVLFTLNLYSIVTAAATQAESLIESRLNVGKRVLRDELVTAQMNFSSNVATIAKDWGFRQAVGQGAGEADIKNILQNYLQRIEADYAFVTDNKGNIVSSTLDAEIQPSFLNNTITTLPSHLSLLFINDKPHFVATESIEAPVKIGELTVASELTEDFFNRIDKLVDLGITLVHVNHQDVKILIETSLALEKNKMKAGQLEPDEEKEIPILLSSSDQNAFTFSKDNQRFLATSFTLPQYGAPNAESGFVVILHDSLSDAMTTFEQFWFDIIPYFVAGILLSLLGAFAIARGITQPVKQLLSAVKLITGGQYSTQFELCQTGELGDLGKEFKTMQSAVKEREDEIKRQAIALQESDRVRYEADLAKKEKELAQEATKAKSEFLASMSHEIRTPLTSIIGFSETLRDQNIALQDHNDAVATINRSGVHLLSVINDILDVSKIEAGKIELEIIDTPLFPLLKEIEKLVEIQAKNKGIAFAIHCQFPLPESITIDPTRLKQILINLINNAIKFTETGQVDLDISFDAPEEIITFNVQDSGIGMTEEQIAKLFSAFSQADSSTTRKHGGTGLGLYICQQLTQLMGGVISATSELNKGSQFTVKLPSGDLENQQLIEDQSTADSLSAELAPRASVPTLGGKVLYADDNADNRRLVSYLVKQTGADIEVVENGEQAVEAALAKHFDIVLMDMQMPEMDGIEATQLLISTGFSNPIIMMTANVDKDSIEKCESSGANGHFGKPIDTEKFYILLSEHLPSSELKKPELDNLIDFQQMVLQFKKELPEKLVGLQLAHENNDVEQLLDIAHQIKGSAGSFGFDNLTKVAADFESAVRNNKERSVNFLFSDLVQKIQQTIEGNE